MKSLITKVLSTTVTRHRANIRK